MFYQSWRERGKRGLSFPQSRLAFQNFHVFFKFKMGEHEVYEISYKLLAIILFPKSALYLQPGAVTPLGTSDGTPPLPGPEESREKSRSSVFCTGEKHSLITPWDCEASQAPPGTTLF